MLVRLTNPKYNLKERILMLYFLPYACVIFLIAAILFTIMLIIDAKRKGEKILSTELKAMLALALVSLIVIYPSYYLYENITKDLQSSVTTYEINENTLYMTSQVSQRGKTDKLFAFKTTDGKSYFTWADYVETDSAPYVEITAYDISEFQSFMLFINQEEYTVYANSADISYVPHMKDVPLEVIENG